MIDFVKIWIYDEELTQQLSDDDRLEFHRSRDRYTSTPYKNLKFTLHDSGRTEIAGSLHKYFNDGAHNWNDFTRVDLWDVIHELCQWLKIAPTQAELKNVEFGVNVVVPFGAQAFLSDLVAYKNTAFEKVAVRKGGAAYQVPVTDYYVKCYDKGSQYNRGENLLRFEVKVRKMRYLEGAGIRTLQDLLTAQKLAVLGDLLFKAWESVAVREPLPLGELTAKEQGIAEAVNSPHLFQQLTRNQRYEARKKYTELVRRYHRAGGAADRKTIVAGLIRDKWRQLTRNDVCTDLQPATADRQKGRLHTLSIRCKRQGEQTVPPPPPTTPATPPPPPEESPTTAQKQHRRNKRKRTHHQEEYYTKHNKRNRRSNPANNLRRRVERAICQTSIFDPLEVIRLNPQQQQQMNYWKGTPWEIKGLCQPSA